MLTKLAKAQALCYS